MKKILIFTGIRIGDNESAIEGMIKKSLARRLSVTLVYFDKNSPRNYRQGDCLVLRYRCARFGLAKALGEFVDPADYDFIVVRNLFKVLRQILRMRPGAKVGFWESFPHSHERVERAEFTGRSVMRKRIEYGLKSKLERKLIARCDFYMPITEAHKREYYDDLAVPCFPTPMGVDFSGIDLSPEPVDKTRPVRFVYIGAVCGLRRLDVVNRAFLATDQPYVLDYYSYDRNPAVDQIKAIDNPRIRFHGGMDRALLFEAIRDADVGVCFFPHTRTFITASPTKTLEYGALGMAPLVNEMPEYADLLDESCAYLCDFNEDAIARTLRGILATPREVIRAKGAECRRRVRERRNYDILAEGLFGFLMGLEAECVARTPVAPALNHAGVLK
ncbi:MAG: glycosyltransferase family protein [Planctomycetota bacterium]